MRRKAILIGCGLVAFVAAAMFVGPQLLRDPEVSNPEDLRDGPAEPPPPLEFFISDPQLIQDGGQLIQERIVEEGTTTGLEGAPYLIEFSDGRYAFGHSDRAGYTKQLHLKKSLPHQIVWYDTALARWSAKAGTAQPGVAADGAARHR